MSSKNKSMYKAFHSKRKHSYHLDVGLSGFICTCNSKLKEKDCIRESYNILNEFADKLFGPEKPCAEKINENWREEKEVKKEEVKEEEVKEKEVKEEEVKEEEVKEEAVKEEAVKEEEVKEEEVKEEEIKEKEVKEKEVKVKEEELEGEEEDVDELLKKEVETIKAEINKKPEVRRFQVVESGANGIVFIRTNIPDPVKLAHTIVTSLADTQKSKFLLRLIPVEITCKAYVDDVCKACNSLFDKYFAGEAKTFAIICRVRNNDRISRDEFIKNVAELVAQKNKANKTDLTHPQLAVLLEIIRNICCISVVPDYYALKKYNLMELAALSGNSVIDNAEGKEKTENL